MIQKTESDLISRPFVTLWNMSGKIGLQNLKNNLDRPKLFKAKPDDSVKIFELWENEPVPKSSVYWCLQDGCEIVFHFNYKELETVVATAKKEENKEVHWPANVWKKITQVEGVHEEIRKKWFATKRIPTDVVELLAYYPKAANAIEKPNVLTKFLLNILPDLTKHIEHKQQDSPWITKGLKWIMVKGVSAVKWILKNPIFASLIVLVSNLLRMVLCVYFSDLEAEVVEQILAGIFGVTKSDPTYHFLYSAAVFIVSFCKNFFTTNWVGCIHDISKLTQELLSTSWTSVLVNLSVGLLGYFKRFIKKIMGDSLLGETIVQVTSVLSGLLTCTSEPLSCIQSIWDDKEAQYIAITNVVKEEIGLRLGMFGLLLLLKVFGFVIDRICFYYSQTIPWLGQAVRLASDHGVTVSNLMIHSVQMLNFSSVGVFVNLADMFWEFHGWVEVVWGCGFKRMVRALSVKLSLAEPSTSESNIACCMANVVQDLRRATQSKSLIGNVKDKVKSAYNFLFCDARYKTMVFQQPVATVRYGRKIVKFYAFMWKPQVPFVSDQRIHIAPMAQKFARQFPETVHMHPEGYGFVIAIEQCPHVLQQAFTYFQCPVISLTKKIQPVIKELTGPNTLFT